MKMQFEVPSEVGYATLTAYQQFEFDIRDAIGFYDAVAETKGKELRRRVGLAISRLEGTFCPKQKEVNNNAS
jgi:hypothetical protein